MSETQKLRNLKIKTGVVRRYAKEVQSYVKEAEDQKKKIEKFREEGKDELFLRQQIQCLKESEMMVPDIERRLIAAHDELKKLTESEFDQLGEFEEFKQAMKIIQEVEPAIAAATNPK